MERGKLYWFTPNNSWNVVFQRDTVSSPTLAHVRTGDLVMFLGYSKNTEPAGMNSKFVFVRVIFNDLVGYLAVYHCGGFEESIHFTPVNHE